jgi:hypothetical protein
VDKFDCIFLKKYYPLNIFDFNSYILLIETKNWMILNIMNMVNLYMLVRSTIVSHGRQRP